MVVLSLISKARDEKMTVAKVNPTTTFHSKIRRAALELGAGHLSLRARGRAGVAP